MSDPEGRNPDRSRAQQSGAHGGPLDLLETDGSLLSGRQELVPGHGQGGADHGLLDRAYTPLAEQGVGHVRTRSSGVG